MQANPLMAQPPQERETAFDSPYNASSHQMQSSPSILDASTPP